MVRTATTHPTRARESSGSVRKEPAVGPPLQTAARREKLRAELKQTEDAKRARRLAAVLFVMEGEPLRRVEKVLGVSHETLLRWVGAVLDEAPPRTVRRRV